VELFGKYKDSKMVVIDVLYVRTDGSTDADVIALKLE